MKTLVRISVVAVAVMLVAVGASATTVTPGTAAQVAAAVRAAVKIKTLPSDLTPTLSAANGNTATEGTPSLSACIVGGTTLTAPCVFGDPTGKKTVDIWGDSHAEMWFPAVNAMAKRLHWKLVALVEWGCPVADLYVTDIGPGGPYTACQGFRANMIARINKQDPALVLMSESFYSLAANHSTITDAEFQAGMEATLHLLHSKGTKYAIIGNLVSTGINPVTCMASNLSNIQACDQTDSTKLRLQRAAESNAAAATGATFVNEVPWECSTTCTPVVGHYVVYHDDGHISATYSAYLSVVLQDALGKLV